MSARELSADLHFLITWGKNQMIVPKWVAELEKIQEEIKKERMEQRKDERINSKRVKE